MPSLSPKRFGHSTKESSSKATQKRSVRKYGWKTIRRRSELGQTDDGLHRAFASYGKITEATVITDRDTGRSRGFGFVTFSQEDDAKTAISKMDGTSLDGKTIKVNEAQEKSPRGSGRSGGSSGGSRGSGHNRC